MPSIYRFMWFTVAVILVMFSGAIMAAQKPAILMMAEGDDHGTHLVTEDGISVYLFMADEPHSGQSACQDQCLVFWHPVWTNEEPQAEDGVHKDELSYIRRSAGSFQATYNGWPLYTFVQDQNPGEAHGQAMNSFNGYWYLVTLDGEPVKP